MGRLGPMYKGSLNHLNGCLAQVVELFKFSDNESKKSFNRSIGGVVLCALVECGCPGDRALNQLLRNVDIDSEVDCSDNEE